VVARSAPVKKATGRKTRDCMHVKNPDTKLNSIACHLMIPATLMPN
jgi:hypothetical protein